MTETTGGRRSGGRAARQAARAISNAVSVPYITRALKPFEVLSEEHLSLIEENADTVLEQVGIEFRDTPEALQLFKEAGADIDGERVRFPRGLARSIVQASRSGDLHAGRPQPGAHRRDRRPEHGARPGLRLAVRPRPRQRAPLRDDRGLPQLRQADLHDAVPAPLGRHGLRAGRRAREQAALRHGLRAHALLRQGVHGLGDAPEPGRGHGRDGQDPVRRRLPRVEHGDRLARQRELADGLGLDDARCGEGVRGGQPGRADHAVHPRRRDEPGNRRRHGDADARRGARRDGVLPARAARRAR